MRTWLGAAALMATACAAEAATMGYQWSADDGSLAMLIDIEPGETWADLVTEAVTGSVPAPRLIEAAMRMLGSMGTNFGAGPDSVGGEIYRDKIVDEVAVPGGTCYVDHHDIYEASISFETGDLVRSFYYDVRGVDPVNEGADCSGLGQSFGTTEPTVFGTWAAVGGAPAHPSTPPAPVPLPASAVLLGAALAGLWGVRRRSAPRP